jgi:hypothetical protein
MLRPQADDESGAANPWTCSASGTRLNAQHLITKRRLIERAGARICLHLQGRETSPEPLFQLFAEINQE